MPLLSRVTYWLESLGSWLIDLETRACHAVVDYCAYLIAQWNKDCELADWEKHAIDKLERITDPERFLEPPMPFGRRANRANLPNRRWSSGPITEDQTDLIAAWLTETDTTLESVMQSLGLMFLGDDLSQLSFDDAHEAIDHLLQRRRGRDT